MILKKRKFQFQKTQFISFLTFKIIQRFMISKYMFSQCISSWTFCTTDTAYDIGMSDMICLNVDTQILLCFGSVKAIHALIYTVGNKYYLGLYHVINLSPS